MARPRKNDEDKKGRKITVRFNQADYERVRREAQKVGVLTSEFLRAKALSGYVRIPKYARLDVRQVNELSRLGGLANKIHVESRGAYTAQTAETLRRINAILAAMEKQAWDDREAHTEQDKA
jgi:hypothetical protein